MSFMPSKVRGLNVGVILSEATPLACEWSAQSKDRYTLAYTYTIPQEGILAMIPITAPENALRTLAAFGAIGVLRLHHCFAMRSSDFAQDDNWAGCVRFSSSFSPQIGAPGRL
jgi:hypothetical protein